MSAEGVRRAEPRDPAAAAERAFRDEGPKVLATLIRQVGDFQLAEDALQDALAEAMASWPQRGVPDNPPAWITVTARRRAIDRLRRDRTLADRMARLRELTETATVDEEPERQPAARRPPRADLHLLPSRRWRRPRGWR